MTADKFCLLRISGLDKRYLEGGRSRPVLNNLDLTAAGGEVLALLGSSGVGKSTLLNLIAGIDVPDAGTIEINGQRVSALNEAQRSRWRRRQLGFVFQFFNLLPTLTVGENARLPLQLNNMDDAQHRQYVNALFERVGLAGREDSFPENLSGGEQQRLAVIRAMVHKPVLLLADEPTGNLDKETGAEVLTLMLDLAATQNTAVVMVTHSEAVAARAHRVLRLEAGRLQAVIV